jgi:thiol-disulfide isomerase/thioredoxin
MKINSILIAASLASMFVASVDVLAQDGSITSQVADAVLSPFEPQMPSLNGATLWLNSAPLTSEQLRGKVVVVAFWNYTCINWIRELPYVRAWAEKYKRNGLVVIGVHSPEFEFEKDPENVRRALSEMRIDYPVAMDSKHVIWDAFDNQYWPALYFVDSQGRVRHHHFGEGEYEASELLIQKLLVEAGVTGFDHATVPPHPEGVEASADWDSLRSPETYIGYDRAENFNSSAIEVRDESVVYPFPVKLALNNWALGGDWTVKMQAAYLNKAGGRIAYQFHARDLHVVMGPAVKGTEVRFRILIDGHVPGPDHGVDVDGGGNGTVTEQRLYQLVRQKSSVKDRRFEIEFLDPGVEAYSFTFG